jgi:hypothetical protein
MERLREKKEIESKNKINRAMCSRGKRDRTRERVCVSEKDR